MKMTARYYFEGDVPCLDEICEKIRQEYPGKVEVETYSHSWTPEKADDYENEQRRKGMEKFESDVLGIDKGSVNIQCNTLKVNGEAIQLRTYTCRVKHIDLESCHTKNTYELYEYAGKVLEAYGGKIKEFTEEEIRKFKRKQYWGLFYWLIKISILVILYLIFDFTLLQLLLIMIGYLIVRRSITVYLVYKEAKKREWIS